MDLREADILGAEASRHWYYVAKGRALRALLNGSKVDEILDVGAGSGVFSRQMLDAGLASSAVCVDTAYPQEHSELVQGKPIRFVRRVDGVAQDLILMIDVLEHVEDDCALLRAYTDTMPPNARVVISVPAFQWLWSGHDEFLGHYRRYTRQQLEALVQRAGLRLVSSRYYFGLLLPVAIGMRVGGRLLSRFRRDKPRSDLATCPAWLNAALILLHSIERRIILPWNRFGGLSVFCVATR